MVSVDILFFLPRTVKLQPQSSAIRKLLQSAKDLGSNITYNTPLEEFTGFGDTLYIFWYFRIKGNQYIERRNTKKEMASGGSLSFR